MTVNYMITGNSIDKLIKQIAAIGKEKEKPITNQTLSNIMYLSLRDFATLNDKTRVDKVIEYLDIKENDFVLELYGIRHIEVFTYYFKKGVFEISESGYYDTSLNGLNKFIRYYLDFSTEELVQEIQNLYLYKEKMDMLLNRNEVVYASIYPIMYLALKEQEKDCSTSIIHPIDKLTYHIKYLIEENQLNKNKTKHDAVIQTIAFLTLEAVFSLKKFFDEKDKVQFTSYLSMHPKDFVFELTSYETGFITNQKAKSVQKEEGIYDKNLEPLNGIILFYAQKHNKELKATVKSIKDNLKSAKIKYPRFRNRPSFNINFNVFQDLTNRTAMTKHVNDEDKKEVLFSHFESFLKVSKDLSICVEESLAKAKEWDINDIQEMFGNSLYHLTALISACCLNIEDVALSNVLKLGKEQPTSNNL